MHFARYVFIFGLVAFLMLNCQILNAYEFKMTNVICESLNKTLAVIVECRLRAISRNKTTLTALVNVLEPVNSGMVRFKVFKKANGYKPWLMDYTADVCAFILRRNHPVGKMYLNAIKGTHTFTHPCPYVGINGIKDFYFPYDLPIQPPSGDYRIDLTWMTQNKIVLITKYSFSFVEDK